MKRAMCLLSVVILVPGLAAAQTDLESMQEHMNAVGFMVGEWAGEGWIAMGPDGPQKFSSRETIESRLDGLVLVIEGVHESLEETNQGETIHHAVATLSWNDGAGVYDFRSHLANGRSGDYEGRIEAGAFVWGMEIPGRTIRYTITIDEENQWTEVGETSTDGTTWSKFFEMTLQRVD